MRLVMVMIRCCTGLPGAEGNGENQASFLGLLLDPPPPRSSPTARSPPPHSSNQGAPGSTLPNTEGVVVVSRKGTRRCPKIAPRTFKCRDRHHQRRAIHHPERTRKPQTKDHALCQAELASDHIGPHIPVIGSVLSPGSGSGGICRCFCPLVSRTRKAKRRTFPLQRPTSCRVSAPGRPSVPA